MKSNQNTEFKPPDGYAAWLDEIEYEEMEQLETDLPNRGLALPATEKDEVKE